VRERGLVSVLALIAFIFGAIFFGLAVFDVTVEDVDLIAAGLFSCAIGFVLDHV